MTEKRLSVLIGETLREIGVLLVVFYPLEYVIGKESASIPVIAGFMTMSFIFIAAGMYLETR